MYRAVLGLCLVATFADAQESDTPLSAIDWLSLSVEAPIARALEPQVVQSDETPVSGSGASPNVTTTSLDTPTADTVGLLSPDVTGLPRDLWSASDQDVLISLIQAASVESLPALQDIMMSLLLAEASPPGGASGEAALFLARIDKLLDMGALEPAQALIEAAGPEMPTLYRRWFDISLLTGTEDRACAVQQRQPALAPTYPARIFCLARNGDWPTAALTLNTARALGQITTEEDALLSRFLDAEAFEDAADLDPPSRPSPLVFRLREAIGQSLPTAGLPRAFAQADLRDIAPWRFQMQAAERLIRTNAVDDNVLVGFYTERRPAASGGVWDRADAFQEFNAAIDRFDTEDIAQTLPTVWDAMEKMRAEVFFARLYAPALFETDLPASATRLRFRIGLLAPSYTAYATAVAPATREERFWHAIAVGDLAGASPNGRQEQAVLDGLSSRTPPDAIARQIAEGRTGEALLRGLELFDEGLTGDTDGLADALAVLVALDMHDIARRTALQYLILDRRS